MKLIIPQFWHNKNSFLSIILQPLSSLYGFISRTLQLIQARNIYTSKAKIITVGNITLGGAGKTPVVLSIAKVLHNRTKNKIAVLTRGYKGKLLGPILVKDNHKVYDVGDEALLLAKSVETCIAKNRLEGIKFLESQGYDIIITDDGMQDMRFKKDLTILVIDSHFYFGNQKIFPAGPLRESIETGINKANLITVLGNKTITINSNKPLIRANIFSKVILNDKNKYIAFAGIGNPTKFFNSVIESEGNLIETIIFPDHHNYTDLELEKLIKLANDKNARLITTEKDFTRINDKFKQYVETLPITLVWEKEDKLIEKLIAL